MNFLPQLLRFLYISSIISQSFAQSTDEVNERRLSTNMLPSVQNLDQLHLQDNGGTFGTDPVPKSLRGTYTSKGEHDRILRPPGKVEAVTDDRRLVSQVVQRLFTTPVKDWTLEQWLLLLVIFWLVSYFLRRFHCGCLQDILACFCCYSLFCDDGTLAYMLH